MSILYTSTESKMLPRSSRSAQSLSVIIASCLSPIFHCSKRHGMGHTLRQTSECFSNARFKACMCFKLAAYHELGGLSHALSRFLPFVYYPKRGLSYEHKVDKFTSSIHNLNQIK